jgi:DNA-binding CsgD family transcriptional regulator
MQRSHCELGRVQSQDHCREVNRKGTAIENSPSSDGGTVVQPVQRPSRGRPRRPAVRIRHVAEARSALHLATLAGMADLHIEALRRSVEQAHAELRQVMCDLEALTHATPERGLQVVSSIARLTRPEERVAVLAARGWTNVEIGKRINVKAETVKTHLKGIFRKLDIHSRWELSYLLNPEVLLPIDQPTRVSIAKATADLPTVDVEGAGADPL